MIKKFTMLVALVLLGVTYVLIPLAVLDVLSVEDALVIGWGMWLVWLLQYGLAFPKK